MCIHNLYFVQKQEKCQIFSDQIFNFHCLKNLYILQGHVFVMNYTLNSVVRKPDFCLCENKDADQLFSNCTADQHLCFGYMDSTIPPLPLPEISRF